ncbi:MAG: acylphosphatase [Candidatus Hydrothermarchaeaceae archaeon]
MVAKVVRYNLTLRGRVQDTGFRSLIEYNARTLGIRGYVFNDIDGSVKVVCEGAEGPLSKFIDSVDIKDTGGVFVEGIQKEEAPLEFPIPPRFARLETDALEDLGRKLDSGITSLNSMDKKLGKLDTIDKKLGKLDTIDKKLGKLDTIDKKLGKLDTIDKKLGKLDTIDKKLGKLDTLAKGQDRMIDVLEEISSKL